MSSEAKESAFLARYEKLNAAQKQAVDTIYGPVMVIAGPGTGKTEVLSMRIAKLLLSDSQIQPHEILCLTYTDEATLAMRRRLLQIIGADAHKVQINTFHGFCNNIIQSAPEYFSLRELQPITDLERNNLMKALLDALPEGHLFRRLSDNYYYDIPRLLKLFEFMKKEAWNSESFSRALDEYLAGIPNDPGFRYLRKTNGFEKGDLKMNLVEKAQKDTELLRTAALLYDDYLRRMQEGGFYDFIDMILMVLQAFQTQPVLLETYQERFQFVLADEFQDTNGVQNELLLTLTQYWEDPNIFVVGDDDQSIYEFQGARLKNIIEFYRRYEKVGVQLIVLRENYRSSQHILDTAAACIGKNKQRLVNQLSELGLDKHILSKNTRFADAEAQPMPAFRSYAHPMHEAADVAAKIEALQRQGVPLHEVAVLYAQHKQSEMLLTLLQRKGIPYCVKKPVDVLASPMVQHIVGIFQYLEYERKEPFSGEPVLFELLHAPWFRIPPTDLAQLTLYISSHPWQKKPHWRFVLNNALLLESSDRQLRSDDAVQGLSLQAPKALLHAGVLLENWMQQLSALPIPLLLEKILYDAGILEYVLRGQDYVSDLQVLHSFFAFVRDSCRRNPRMRLAEFLEMIDQMKHEGITLALDRILQQDNGVRFFSAHGAKGTEFEHVFLIGCNPKYWEKKSGNCGQFKLPPTIIQAAQSGEKSGESEKTEVARRLFYVALTRAKKFLNISWNLTDEEGKATTRSGFVDEICPEQDHPVVELNEAALVDALSLSMSPEHRGQIELLNRAWVERRLQGLTMSYSHLSKFLRCPLSYYYEHILRVPMLSSAPLSFGIAVHYALEHLFEEMKKTGGEFPPKERLIQLFEIRMNRERDSLSEQEFVRRMEQGRKVLDAYYDHNIGTWTRDVLVEYMVPRYLLDGVPVTGKIDKLELQGNTCYVVDYKTGNPEGNTINAQMAAPNDKNPDGGDYWRQMVFYKLLLEHAPDARWQVAGGRFEYVEQGRTTGAWKTVQLPVYEADEQIVRAQLRDVYSRIMNLEFGEGCGKADCNWCQFARNNGLLHPAETVKTEDV